MEKKESFGSTFPIQQNAIEAFETIFHSCRKSKICKEYLSGAKKNLDYIAEKFGIEPIQTVLLSIVIGAPRMSISDMADYLDISNMRMLSLEPFFIDLVDKKIITKKMIDRFDHENVSYRITAAAQNAILKDEAFVPASQHCTDEDEFFVKLDNLYCECDDNDISGDELEREIVELFQENQDLPFVKKFNEISKTLKKEEKQILLLLCMLFIIRGEKEIDAGEFKFIFDDRVKFRKISAEMAKHNSALLKKNLVEINHCDGVAIRNSYTLSDSAVRELFPMLVTNVAARHAQYLHSYKEIEHKELFYNAEEQEQIATLFDLLGGNHLKQVQSRLSKNGMRTGVNCLLYGTPGTGKTATVLEIARTCRRDIFRINMSDLRSKWVGESEKLCQQLWDDYNACVKNSKRTPILLLNECDGILTSRKQNPESSVDKMENTMAAIFLENLENHSGIVIATTNLAANLDPAFDRRFIYKVRFGKPCLQARQSIWKTMLPKISDSDAETIAKEYDFSGGQIENIARKSMVDFVLKGQEPTCDTVRKYCKQETIKDGTESKSIGFGK